MGKTGVSLSEIYVMRWNEFCLFLRGMVEREFDAKAYLLRDIMFNDIIGNPHIDKKDKPVKPTDLIVFPFEKPKKAVILSKDQSQQIIKAFKI
jgi:hypothetical protein